MTRKIRVLIVDDSTVIRRLLSETLAEDHDIEIAGTAANGKIALAKIPQINPDVVTLDMEMPEMDGIATLVELKKLYPKIPVIMFSTLTQRGAHATFDALAKGACDYVTKPANVGSVGEAIENVRRELTPKLKAFCTWFTETTTPPVKSKRHSETLHRSTTQLAPPTLRAAKLSRVDILAIGASTGGPNALATALQQLPADFPIPIVIVQHMPPMFTTYMAQRLDQACQISVTEAVAGDTLRPGAAWIAPGGYHMTLHRDRTAVRIELNEEPPENSCRPAVDVLFRSVSEIYGPHTMASVMTGMGRDGLLGCQAIKAHGGRVIAQDEATSVVWGMPKAVIEAKLADQVVPLDAMAEQWILQTSEIQKRHVLTRTR